MGILFSGALYKQNQFLKKTHSIVKPGWFHDGAVFTTLHFLYNLQIGPISCSVCPWQASQALCNVILHHIGPISKWSVVNTIPRVEVEILTLLPFLTRESRQDTFVDVCGRICKTFGPLKCIRRYKQKHQVERKAQYSWPPH